MIRFGVVDISRWLVHVDCFGKVTVKEGILDVELSQWPIASYSKMEYSSYSCWLDNWAERLVTVDARSLCFAVNYQSRLVPFDRSIWIKLVAK